MPYYCQPHGKAFERPDQWRGHWTASHKGEEKVTPEEALVDTVPEGIEIVRKALKQQKQERAAARAPSEIPFEAPDKEDGGGVGYGGPGYGDEDPDGLTDEAFLDRALEGIGAMPDQRKTIVRGYMVFPALRDNLTNLQTFIISNLRVNQRPMVPMVISAIAQRMSAAGLDPGAGPMYMTGGGYPGGIPGAPGYMPAVPVIDQWGRPMPGYQQPHGYPPARPMYMPDFYEAPRRRRSSEEDEDPVVKELKTANALLNQRLDDEKKEREKERDEQRRKEDRAEIEARMAQTDARLAQILSAISGAKAGTEAEGVLALKEELVAMRKNLEDERQAKFLEELGRLSKTNEDFGRELANIKSGAGQSSNGKTTEDLISQGIPFVMNGVTSLGDTVKEELRGIRSDIKSLPVTIGAPTLPGGGARVAEAKKIAALSSQEKSFLARASGRPGLG